MLCDICKKNPVKVKIVKVVNGKKIERNVCETCARVHENIKIQEVKKKEGSNIEALLKNAKNLDSVLDEMKDKQCIMCGMDMKKFVKTGKLGCPNCYNEFKDTIDFLIDKIQNPEKQSNSNEQHVKQNNARPVIEESGKTPEISLRLRKLRRELKKKLKEEAYEEAAQIRDEIEKIESESN